MRIAITGSSGLVGKSLLAALERSGHSTMRIVRRTPGAKEIRWDPEKGEIESQKLEGIEGIVHLAGENIAAGRWTKDQKERIRDSRVQGTSLLSRTLAQLARKPHVLVSASAIGFYGDRGDYVCDEGASCGTGFLADVCEAWEAAAEPAVHGGIRVIHPRIGLVLSGEGGALKKMLTPFKLGVGGVMGSGRQYWSWIALDDLVGAIIHCLNADTLRGPVNVVAPRAVTNHEFTKSLGNVLHRPTILPMPAFAARLVFGEMADALILASTHVVPKRLQESSFTFQYPELTPALEHVLGLGP